MKKIIAILLAAATLMGAAFAKSAKGTKVGVSMPTKDLQRWNQDGANMKAELEKAGFVVDLQYANNEVATQISQIENMITGKCKILVIVAIEGSSLSNVLEQARKKKIQVIAYDRLIMNTKAVSYYATFDNELVGKMQGEYLEKALNLKNRTKADPAYMEFFTGDPGDNNANFFFNGAMKVIKPYLDSGVVVCRSGQTTKAQVATLGWSTEEAQKRMENLITSNKYGPKGTKLDAVLCSNDSTALGATNALVSAGYTKANIPLITGQDCDIANTKNMIKGLQAMNVFKDTRVLAAKVLEMIQAIGEGKKVSVNNTTDYNNNEKNLQDPSSFVPSFLCTPEEVTSDNAYDFLVNQKKYYTAAELK
jgi:putative multiple sugar transport system substrate-binding protein